MFGSGPPKNNAESWQQIHEFIEEYPDDVHWLQWKLMARSVISDLEKLGLATLFRVGQSMHHIIFSTLDHHRLNSEPRVTLEFDPGQQTVRVAYSRANLSFNAPLIEAWVSPHAAVTVTLGALRRLWTESRPDQPMPEELQDRKQPLV